MYALKGGRLYDCRLAGDKLKTKKAVFFLYIKHIQRNIDAADAKEETKTWPTS